MAERKAAKSRRPDKVSIFISYASEDKDLAASVEAELLQLFAFTPVKIFRDVGIPKGANYKVAIAAELDAADILLVLLTSRMKPSYSYPGYEVGYFMRSLEQRPKIFENLDRVIIPVCIGSDSPATIDYIQSIRINSDQVFKISDAATTVGDQNPAFTLLQSISNIVMAVLGTNVSAQNVAAALGRLNTSAARLYSSISEYLQGRISSETYPERKIIIRTDTRPEVRADGADLETSKVELIGDSFHVFGFPEDVNREFTWADFKNKMPDEFGGTWSEGIRLLVTNVLQGGDDNYHVVTTIKGDKAFRLFVSRILTYVSKKTEIHIYIVEMVVRQYGDPLTTRLLTAISIGLRFRFLLLEKDSKFNPDRLEFPMAIDVSKEPDFLRAAEAELLSQMDLVLRDAKDARLMDADILELIWGRGAGGHVQQMMGLWEHSRAGLYSAAQQVLSSNVSNLSAVKQSFISALRALCAETETMNREYTLRALRVVTGELDKSAALAPESVRPDPLAN